MEGYGNENPGAFQPTRPLRGATEIAHKLTDTIKFQPTRPLRGATRPASSGSACRSNFNPRAPCGARPWWCAASRRWNVFQPTRPLRGATPCFHRGIAQSKFQPTRPLRGATLLRSVRVIGHLSISTHAPLAGRDRNTADTSEPNDISTHAPLAGRDRKTVALDSPSQYFNPRAPCGARRSLRV